MVQVRPEEWMLGVDWQPKVGGLVWKRSAEVFLLVPKRVKSEAVRNVRVCWVYSLSKLKNVAHFFLERTSDPLLSLL